MPPPKPPPKVKLHKASGKARPVPQKLSQALQNAPEPGTSSSEPPSSPSSSLTAEQEQQFEMELYWCIQQLRGALSAGKLTNKQIQDHTKTLNTLMGNSAPMVKKRQVMRLSFGDYRSKMLEEEKKMKKLSIKVAAGHPSDKSVFLRKALINTTGKDFKFNFPGLDKLDSEEDQPCNSVKVLKNPTFSKSDNSFRFNFLNNEAANPNNSS